MPTNYDHLGRRGIRSSTSIDPKNVLEDIDTQIRTIDPHATPLLTLSSAFSKGKKPRSHKIQVVEYHGRDQIDYCSSVTLGTGNNTRFAKLTLDMPSMPTTKDVQYYYIQDKFYIAATDQTVEVVMTPGAAASLGGTELSLPTSFTGNTASRTEDGTVIVRNVERHPIQSFTTSDVYFMGRTIRESQDIEAVSRQRDLMYDCNFVEHKEAVLIFTEDQKKIIETKAGGLDWTFQQQQTFKEFKNDVESTLWWGERAVNLDHASRPTRHMRGMHHAIRTNVSAYNPMAVTDYEELFGNFLYDQAFRYNPNGYNKLGYAGGRFLFNFNKAFREYRRTVSLDPKDIGSTAGMDLETYMIPGGMKVALSRVENLRQNTSWEDWCYIIDPSTIELRIVKDFQSRMYANNDERDIKAMIEWQGTMAHHTEQANALLRTF